MVTSRLNLSLIVICYFAALSLPMFGAGCGDEGEKIEAMNPALTDPTQNLPQPDNPDLPESEPPKEDLPPAQPKVSFQKDLLPILVAWVNGQLVPAQGREDTLNLF